MKSRFQTKQRPFARRWRVEAERAAAVGGAPVTVRQMRNANTCHAQLLNFSATPHRLPNHCACTIVPRETPGLEPQLCYKWTGEQLFV
eukprot:9503082-Pyramimonas_sp.AAC.1